MGHHREDGGTPGPESWSVGPPPPAPARSSRGGAVLVVLALVAGFVGGMGAGYALDDGPRTGVDAVGAVGAVGADLPPSAVVSETITAIDEGATVATTVIVSGSGEAIGPTPRNRLFRRVSAGGYSVRVFSRDYGRPAEEQCADGRWCPPPECTPTGGIEADVIGEWTVTGGGGPDFPVRDGQTARLLGVIVNWDGQDEPAFGAILRTSEGVQSVRLTGGGVTDEMAPIDGIAVVVIPSSAVDRNGYPTIPSGVALEVVDASGNASVVPLAFGSTPDPQCTPPPPAPPMLPAPGEQPEDVATQDTAVRERFAYVFGPDSSEKLAEAVDDPSGLDVLRTVLKDRHPEAIGNVEYEVGELVFTSPDAAAYLFRPVVSGRALPWQIGGARVVDGKWMITRATVCAMYRLGGSNC